MSATYFLFIPFNIDRCLLISSIEKVSLGEHGGCALKGEYESTAAIHAVSGDFTPKPIAQGSFHDLPGTHYYICKFYDLSEELPEPSAFCEQVASLHAKSNSPNGKYGFHTVTYNGDLPQENRYTDSWEEFYCQGFTHMVNMNVQRGGPWPEMEPIHPIMLSKVIPRLLRPLETNGNSIKPSLVHGDLWCGNAAIDISSDQPLVFDPSSFYAHNECKINLPLQ